MGFELPRVTRCCFCFSLRTGTLIIGYMSLISAVLMIATTAFFIYLVAAYVTQNEGTPPAGHTQGDVITVSTRLYIIHSLQILIYTFYFTSSLMLVIGAHKNKPSFMRYYYIAGMINLVLNLVLVTGYFVFTGFSTTVSQLISCAIIFYFLLVVRSAFLDMEEQAKRPPAYEMRSYGAQQAPLIL